MSDFVKRVRLQLAASRLAEHPELSVTEAALAVGFSGPSVFARAFKERFGVTASEWRRMGREARRALAVGGGAPSFSKDGQKDRKETQEGGAADGYPFSISENGGSKEMSTLSYKVRSRICPN